MLIMHRPFTDPYLNLAAEEYFVKQATEDICMIWVNEQSVIIGKHQNAFAEINYPYVRTNLIPVIRRISGGGAVYHDRGNVNFSFIRKTNKVNQVDFKQFTSIVIEFMQTIGIEVTTNTRNSLFVNELKFSGHAEHIFHDKVLHHGTMLFNTDLEVLNKSLNPEKEYQGKALPSVRSHVGNIAPLLSEKLDIHLFIDKFISFLIDYFPGSNKTRITEDDLQLIDKLAEEKYRTWQWNFGYSPSYSFKIDFSSFERHNTLVARVENGHFTKIDFTEYNSTAEIKQSLQNLTGLLHNEKDIEKYIENNRLLLELAGINTVLFKDAFFS